MKLLTYTFRRGLLVAVCLASLYGCNLGDVPNLDNVYLPTYNGDVAIILVRDTVNMGDFLEKNVSDSTAVKEGPTQEILFEYRTESEFTLGEDFVAITPFTNSEVIANPIAFPYTTTRDTTLVITDQFVFTYQSGEREEIDSVFYESGTVQLEVQSEFPGELQYNFLVTAFRQVNNQSPLEFNATLPPTSTITSDIQSSSLEGYKTNLFREDEQNKFFADVEMTIDLPEGTTVTGAEEVFFTFDVLDPETQSIFGYFEEDTIEVQTKRITLGVFEDFTGKGIEFENPSIRLEVANSFGIPLGVDLSDIFAQYDDQPDLRFSGPITESPQPIAAPGIEQYLDPVVASSIEITPENSNLRELMAATPERIVIPLKAYSNLTPGNDNFLNNDSRIDVVAVAQLPMSLRLDGFEYDTDIELGDLDQLNQTEGMSLLFRTTNELPFSGEVNIIFNDDAGNSIDSIVGNVLFEPPTGYDTNGKATEPALAETVIELDQGKIDALTSASTMTIITRLNSYGHTEDEFVKVFADYELVTTVSVSGTLKIDLNQE